MSWTVDKGPCGCCGPTCCGIPANCELGVTDGCGSYYYNPGNGNWENPTCGNASVSFGDCYTLYSFPQLMDPKYHTCCLSFSAADTPYLGEGLCNEWAVLIYARVVCDSCCDPSTNGGVNCRLTDTLAFTIVNGALVTGSESNPCTPYIPLVEWIEDCLTDGCNPLP